MTVGRRRRVSILVTATLSRVAACTSGEDGGARSQAAAHPSVPFAVASVPAGSERQTAEYGRQLDPWGDDTYATAEPFTVLARRGRDATDPEAIVVSVTGFPNYEGGLGQAAPARIGFDRSSQFTVDGHRAIFTPAQTTTDGVRITWADLVAVRARDLAVRVRARNATKDQLLDVFRRVEPAARTLA